MLISSVEKVQVIIRSIEVKILKWIYAIVGTLSTKAQNKWDKL